jgi:hypothetical protein
MITYLESLFRVIRPAFSRRATFAWFILTFMGFAVRQDTFGVSSIVRALWLEPRCYPCLLHFFHSTAWEARSLLECWWRWLIMENAAYRAKGRIILVGDHTKTPKDGRRMPEVTTLHQDSETASKPRYFRGHHWGCIGLLVQAGTRFFATPLWAEIHNDSLEESRATRIVTAAETIATAMGSGAYLVLDAFFAVGPVFRKALQHPELLHILTRAKKNVVAYEPPRARKKRGPGRPRQYGRKLKLAKLFDSRRHQFKTTSVKVYQQCEKVRYLTLDLIWKPVKQTIRFFLVESSRGQIILMTSDLALTPVAAIELYCRRVTIETLFDRIKNILGGMRYHFWSKYLKAASRRPTRKGASKSTSSRPDKTRSTLRAIEKFFAIQVVVLGSLQLLARRFASQVHRTSRCWLRTPSGEIPSEFVTRTALSNLVRINLLRIAEDSITQEIIKKQPTDTELVGQRKAG